MLRLQPVSAALLCVACAPAVAPPPPAPAAEPAVAEPTSAPADAQRYTETAPTRGDDGSELFGPPQTQGDPIPMERLVAAPGEFAGKVLKVEGTVRRVCQNMGCWVELEGRGPERLRVPMAGHALSIPQRAIGKTATIEGEVEVRELSEGEKAHYAAEGMTATDQSVSISANSVLVSR